MIHKFRLISVLCLLMALILCMTSCVSDSDSVRSIVIKKSDIITGSGSASFHMTDNSEKEVIGTYGNLSLAFDSAKAAPVVTDSENGNIWCCLPSFDNGSACVFDIVLRKSDGIYYLNSQDNSVQYGTYKYEKTDTGVNVQYLVADTRENAVDPLSSVTGGAAAKLTVEFTLTDGDLCVSVDCSAVELSPDTVLESITLMPYFGAYRKNENAENSDFILVPDGCGAVMYTDKVDSLTADLSFDIYGSDENRAVIPAFGLKHNKGAFVAVIEGGASLCTVKAKRPESDPYSAAVVYPTFCVTENKTDGSKYCYSNAYNGKISVCYRFLTGDDVTYTDMALSCRERLIRNGTLSSETVKDDYYPLVINTVASVDGSSKNAVSDFEQTEDLLSLLKAKNVNDIELVVSGAFSGGLVGNGNNSLNTAHGVGSAKALYNLCDYAKTQNFNIYMGVNLFGIKNASSKSAAADVSGKKQTATVKNPLAGQVGAESYTVNPLTANAIEKRLISIMNDAEKTDIPGFAVMDAGLENICDISSGMSKEDIHNAKSSAISSFATRQNIALCSPDIGEIKSASLITDIPLYTTVEETDAYVGVPFVQAVIHSSVTYTGSAANAASIQKLELLKAVEYGALPYYLWVFDESSVYCYTNTYSDAVDFVTEAAENLSDLSSSRIISHSKIESGVYCTGYDNGAFVYVNYNNYSVNIGDISVLPYNYIRVN